VQGQARLGDPLRQIVAQPLQLSQVEDPRLWRERVDPMADLDPAEGLGKERGELALEAADLAPQLGPGEALVDLDAKPHRALSCEQIRHRPASSVDHRSVAAVIHSASSTAICGTPFTWTAAIVRRRLPGSTP
jgi:hypothetical protein